MKLPILIIACLSVSGIAGDAAAQACPHPQSIASLGILLQGKTVCAVLGSDRWQEFHDGTSPGPGALFDWKEGPNHPVDPRKQVGTWSIASVTVGNNVREQVTYSYTGGSSYTYRVCQVGSTYTFQQVSPDSTTITGATLLNGSVQCPSNASSPSRGPVGARPRQ